MSFVEQIAMHAYNLTLAFQVEPVSKGNYPARSIFRRQRGCVNLQHHRNRKALRSLTVVPWRQCRMGIVLVMAAWCVSSIPWPSSSTEKRVALLGNQVNGDSPLEQKKSLAEAPMMEVPPISQPYDMAVNMAVHPKIPIPPPSFMPNPRPQPSQPFTRASQFLPRSESASILTTYADHPVTTAPQGVFQSLRHIRRSLPARERPTSPMDRFATPHGRYIPTLEYESLDIGLEQEENHYINSQAFAELTLEDIKERTRFEVEAPYRQMSSDSKAPVFFTRNPSLIYGLSQAGGAGFFQKACETIGYEWPPRLLPLSVTVYRRDGSG